MAEPKDDPPRTDVVIASEGDIILALPKNRYVRVHSNVLCDCSPVFTAMLGPNFREGQGGRSAAEPKEVELPEDDENGMVTLCQMLHSSSKLTIDTMSPGELLVVAQLADKFYCVPAVSVHTEAVLSRYWTIDRGKLEDADCWDLRLLTAAAYRLNHAWFFYDLTQRFVLDHTTVYNLDVPDTGILALPIRIIKELQTQRSNIQFAIHEDIVCLTSACPMDSDCLPPYEHLLPALGKQLGLPNRMFPPRLRTTPAREILDKLLEADTVEVGYCRHGFYRRVPARALRTFADMTIDSAGLHLEDVKDGLQG